MQLASAQEWRGLDFFHVQDLEVVICRDPLELVLAQVHQVWVQALVTGTENVETGDGYLQLRLDYGADD